jgi:hypothetical protein
MVLLRTRVGEDYLDNLPRVLIQNPISFRSLGKRDLPADELRGSDFIEHLPDCLETSGLVPAPLEAGGDGADLAGDGNAAVKPASVSV